MNYLNGKAGFGLEISSTEDLDRDSVSIKDNSKSLNMTLASDNKTWFKWGIFNLALVALWGMLMRYKIAFDFPFLEQKKLLFAHSYFAFNGWISHMLYSALIMVMPAVIGEVKRKKYYWMVAGNLFCAFGMLIAFTIQGYKGFAIVFSVSSILVSILFTLHYIRDYRAVPSSIAAHKQWAITGLLLNVLSAAGPIVIAYMMITKSVTPNNYLGMVYYNLHFQYNGWFFFAGMALMAAMLPKGYKGLNRYFRIFAITVIPTFFLSILWVKLPMWLYVIVVIASFVQLGAWIAMVAEYFPRLRIRYRLAGYPAWVNIFFYAATIAMTIKFVLQAVSVIPSLSHLVFGFRSIIIAYLHLILLGVFSLFLIGYAFSKGYFNYSKTAKFAAFSFLAGVVLNELILGIQSVTAFTYTFVPLMNEFLFVAAVILFGSAVFLLFSQLRDNHSK